MNYNFPIAFLDPPEVLNAANTLIPKSSSPPLQVVADTGFRSAIGIDYIDTTGEFIGVYVGSEGQEVLKCVIGNGLSLRAWAVIPAHSRVCLRAMKNIDITSGSLQCSFMGY